MSAFRSVVRVLVPAAVAATVVPLVATPAGAAPGDLDPIFGSAGTVVTPIGAAAAAYAVAIQPDGKIVAAGNTYNGANNDFAVARYTPSGSLDPTFGSGGIVTTPIGSGSDIAYGVAVQADGRIVAVGYASNGSDDDFAVARYTASGVLDSTFGTGGKVMTPVGLGQDQALGVAVQPDGKIVAAGFAHNTSFPAHNEFAVVRYTGAGILDSSFGVGGKVTTFVGPSSNTGRAVALQSDGKIVVAGLLRNGQNDDFALVRYESTGTLDSSFGVGGKVITSVGASKDEAFAVAIQADGKIVAAGKSSNGSNDDFALARFTPTGALDPAFGSGGTVITAFGSSNDQASAVAIQPDGKVVAAGYTFNGSNNDFALVRYAPSGTLDSTFGSGGKVTSSIGSSDDYASGLAIQGDGKIVLAGSAVIGSTVEFALARYLGDAITLSVTDSSVTEGDSTTTEATFIVSRAGPPGPEITVHYATASDSATLADYRPVEGTLTFGRGQTSKTVTVAVKGDVTDEPDELFVLRLSNPTNAAIDDGVGVGTIVDNDPAPAISVSDVSVTEGNSGTTYAVFALSLSNPSSEAITVDYETSDGTATAPSDYTAKSGTRVFLAGQTTKTVSVAVKGETAQEPNETFLLNLLDPSGATLSDGQGVATITDDDRPAISINDVSATEVDSGATVIYAFKVTLSKAGTSTVTVQYATANGTAVAPGDYTAKSGTLTYSPGQVSKTVSVTVKGDTAVEPDEVFYVNLSNATGATIADGQGVGTIVNDD